MAIVKKQPNLFFWATSELSQDAFICWLLEWAKPELREANLLLHNVGNRFLSELLVKHGVVISEIKEIEIYRQYYNIDVLVTINSKYAMIIEDKVHTDSHGDQLSRYKKTVTEHFPSCRVLPMFVKTGSQSRYVKEETEGYKLFLRSDFLALLRAGRSAGIANNILLDFLESLEILDEKIRSFLVLPVKQWDSNSSAWIGFYEYLQSILPGLEWDYVANPAGGFFGAWWHFLEWRDCDVYLQIEQGKLCFKIAVDDSEKQSELRQVWHECILHSAHKCGLDHVVRPPRFGKGTWMTVAIIEQENWMIEREGAIDLDETLLILKKAANVLVSAVEQDVNVADAAINTAK